MGLLPDNRDTPRRENKNILIDLIDDHTQEPTEKSGAFITNPVNVDFDLPQASNKSSPSKSRSLTRTGQPPTPNTTFHVRVGTCADTGCTIADVDFAPERTVTTGSNPYST